MQRESPAPAWSAYQQGRSSRRGMQVHAVPDADKAFDASGRKLPWAYDLDASRVPAGEKREPAEKGPFGRSQRRSRSGLSRSRSKTAEPRREEDRMRAEQIASEDAVFGSLRKKEDTTSTRREALGEVDANAAGQGATAAGGSGANKGEMEATEVVLFGFGEDLQWAALDHYERVSGGNILEDYDRQPPGARYDINRSLSRASSQRSLTRAALKKKNKYAGGMHWIKITFDSLEAAELACARSPHIIKGHLVYAEPYQGRGPGKDEPILASQAGAQITDTGMPMTFSTHASDPVEGSPNGSSTTATSATATQRPSFPRTSFQAPAASGDRNLASTSDALSQPTTPGPNTLRRRRISGVTPVTPLPASLAFQPKPPKKSWSALIGAGEVIGSTVPKKEDGSFDYDKASLYWKVFYWVDWCLGTDWCGLKGD